MQNKVKKNFIYQSLYQVFIVLVPLITSPYISRILGAANLGVNAYMNSIANYFVIFAMLGLNTYGNRTIAMVRDKEDDLNKTFSSIFYLHIVISIFVLLLSFIPIFFLQQDYRLIYILNILYVIAAVIDINWLYMGLEDIKSVVIRNIIVKLLSMIIIFAFIRTANDLWIYTLSLSLSTFTGSTLLWTGLKNKVKFVKCSVKDILSHIKPLLVLFLPLIAINLYKYMDKLMLGWFSSMSELGYYENAEKIINIPNNILAAIGLVLLPYSSNLAANKKFDLLFKQMSKTMVMIIFLTIPIMFGLAAVSFELSIVYFGVEFTSSGILICLLALTLLPIEISSVIRTQYLIPLKKDKEFIISLFSGAIANLILNLILIPVYDALGAVIATVIAEYIVFIIQLVLVRKEIRIKDSVKFNVPYFIIGLIMFILVRVAATYLNISIINLLILVAIGFIFYIVFATSYLLIFNFDFALEISSFLKLKYLNNILLKIKQRLGK